MKKELNEHLIGFLPSRFEYSGYETWIQVKRINNRCLYKITSLSGSISYALFTPEKCGVIERLPVKFEPVGRKHGILLSEMPELNQ
jgi:hypothetical protein